MKYKILEKVQEINKIDGLDAFFSYSGHIDSIEVSVNKDAKYREDERHNKIFYKTVYLDWDGADIELKNLFLRLEEVQIENS